MVKVVPDTNILVSATFWKGDSFKILQLIDNKEVDSFLSDEILSEYARVVNSDEIVEKIENKALVVSRIIDRVVQDSVVLDPKDKVDIIKEDTADNRILECAKEGKVDYIITRDKHLLKLKEFEGIPIVKPDEFLKKL